MYGKFFSHWVLAFCCFACVAFAQDRQQEQAPRRAKLPTFERGLTTQFFFDDVFTKLVGPRPASPGGIVVATPAGGGAPAARTGGSSYAWARLISATTIEDEVKSIKLRVDQCVTTPGDFARRGYKQARREFSILAMLFAIINDYDDEVRWKRDAAVARNAFSRLASNAKAGGNSNVYQEAKSRQEDLGGLLRGSGLQGQATQPENVWENLVDRAPLMQRLESGFDEGLSRWTSSEAEFSRHIEAVLREAEIIAAISEVLTREGMEDGDDEDYAGFVKRMQRAASEIAAAVKTSSASQARQAAGEIRKACSECHELYR